MHLLTGLLVLEENGGGRSAELLAAIEAGNLENEHVSHDLTLELRDEVGSSLGRATCVKAALAR